ncbi:MAG: hypothetical protein QXF56_00950 [Candidatus Micrarchaeia archaeon]
MRRNAEARLFVVGDGFDYFSSLSIPNQLDWFFSLYDWCGYGVEEVKK